MVSFSASWSLILISICTKYSIHEVIFDLHTIELQQVLEDGELVEVMSTQALLSSSPPSLSARMIPLLQ